MPPTIELLYIFFTWIFQSTSFKYFPLTNSTYIFIIYAQLRDECDFSYICIHYFHFNTVFSTSRYISTCLLCEVFSQSSHYLLLLTWSPSQSMVFAFHISYIHSTDIFYTKSLWEITNITDNIFYVHSMWYMCNNFFVCFCWGFLFYTILQVISNDLFNVFLISIDFFLSAYRTFYAAKWLDDSLQLFFISFTSFPLSTFLPPHPSANHLYHLSVHKLHSCSTYSVCGYLQIYDSTFSFIVHSAIPKFQMFFLLHFQVQSVYFLPYNYFNPNTSSYISATYPLYS